MKKQNINQFVLGITGNIGCGKSTVAKMFRTKDALIINADKLAHRLYSVGSNAYQCLKKIFGPQILKSNKTIDRKKLAQSIFTKKENLNKLNKIIHPQLIKEIKEVIKNSKKKIIILDAALIIEAGLKNIVDKLIVVTASKEQQILRSQKRLGFSKEMIVRIMKSQISQSIKSRFADFIIDNSGSIEKTRKQVLVLRRTCGKVRY